VLSYKITWMPLSSLSTPLQSDTIFGHLCWAVKYLWEETSLEKLLSDLKENNRLILSSAFPAGTLPKPSLPVKHEIINQIRKKLLSELNKNPIDDLGIAHVLKKARKKPYISHSVLKEAGYVYDLPAVLYGQTKKEALDYIDRKMREKGRGLLTVKDPKQEERCIEFHNMIDRQSGTTSGSGEFFASPTTFFKDHCFESWLDTDIYTLEQLQELFQFIQLHGFGKDKNTGKGRFEIKVEPFTWPNCNHYNAYLCLSNMVPAHSDNVLSSYNGKAKFAKIGGDYATSETPFKYPLLMFEPGAVFFAGENKTPPLGCLLDNIHNNKDIVQNLYAYSIPLQIKGV